MKELFEEASGLEDMIFARWREVEELIKIYRGNNSLDTLEKLIVASEEACASPSLPNEARAIFFLPRVPPSVGDITLCINLKTSTSPFIIFKKPSTSPQPIMKAKQIISPA